MLKQDSFGKDIALVTNGATSGYITLGAPYTPWAGDKCPIPVPGVSPDARAISSPAFLMNTEPAPADSGQQWTPGPWKVEHDDGPQYGNCWRIVGPAGDVAQIVDTDNPAFADAAALLIAAAPELYSALALALPELEYHMQREDGIGDSAAAAFEAARAALALARNN